MIFAVVGIEIGMRLLYPLLAIDALLYTLVSRCIQAAVILGLAWPLCGIRARTPVREFAIGFAVSLAFAVLVLLADMFSRIWIPGGLLSAILVAPRINNPIFFLLVGCIWGPFVEELFFRGMIQAWLMQRLFLLPSILLSALFFACMHGYLAPVQLIGGLLFAGLYAWRANIWAAWVLHVLANIGIWLFPLIYPHVISWLGALGGKIFMVV